MEMSWFVRVAQDVQVLAGPHPSVHRFKEGKTVEWLAWLPGRQKAVNVAKALTALPESGDVERIIHFWRDHGPLVGDYLPSWCRRCPGRKGFELGKVSVPGLLAVPLETVRRAIGLLHAFRQKKYRFRDGDVTLLARLLTELYAHLPEKWKEHAQPPKEVLVAFEGGGLAAVLPHDAQPWWRPYTVRVPLEDGRPRPDRLQGQAFAGVFQFAPAGGQMKALVPCLFPALLHHLLGGAQKPHPCECGCGQLAPPGRKYAHPSHAKRAWWKRNKHRYR